MPLLISLLISLLAFLLPAGTFEARAADLAEYRILGYSANGERFAFEQFGIADGVGLPYADIFVLDLPNDRWVSGSPVRVRRQEGDLVEPIDFAQALQSVRGEAFQQAQPVLQAHGIGAAHRVIAATTPMEAGGQELSLRFTREPVAEPFGDERLLTLERFALPSPVDCFGMVDTHGFRLILQREGGPAITIYEDARLPRSRRCPERYGIAAIVTPFDGEPGRAVALISVYQLGFEGLDRRFLAVPFDLSL